MKKEKLALLGGQLTSTRRFPIFNSLSKEERKAVNEVMKRKVISDFIGRAGGRFLGGKYVLKFEEEICRRFKTKYAVSYNSATTALQGALIALGVGPGDEVITSPYTMSATASVALLNGAVPVFADIDPDNYCLDAKSVEKNITKRTKAIITVNIFGGSSDFDQIYKIAKRHKLKVIEDNAQAIGAKHKDRFLGTVGDIGVFSFNVHKHVQCGEGGVLATDNEKYAFRARLARNHGEAVIADLHEKGGIYEPIVGSNYRLSELHAAVAIEQLKKMNRLNNARIRLANYLSRRLRQFDWLEECKVLKNSTHVYYIYPIKFFAKKIGIKRSTFVEAMEAEGFTLNQGYNKPLYLMPLYQKKEMYPGSKFPFNNSEVSYKKGICPVAERMFFEELLWTGICDGQGSKKDIDLFVKAIKKIEDNIGDLRNYEKNKK